MNNISQRCVYRYMRYKTFDISNGYTRNFNSFQRAKDGLTSDLKNAWKNFKRQQISRNVPSHIIQDTIPQSVYTGLHALSISDDTAIEKEIQSIRNSLINASKGALSDAYINENMKGVDFCIINSISSICSEVSTVGQYLLNAPGKRFRPLFLILIHLLLEDFYNKEASFDISDASSQLCIVAVAELIHVASMIHDDVIDNAEVRRKQVAVHKAFGNKHAILGGDFLLARASAIGAAFGSPQVCLRIAHCLESLVQGELVQASARYTDIETSFTDLLKKSYFKTAVLIADMASCLAILKKCDQQTIHWVYEIGSCIGMAFQLHDDQLDYICTSEKAGKPVLNDAKNGIITAPILFACLQKPNELQPIIRSGLKNENDINTCIEAVFKTNALSRSNLLCYLYSKRVLELLNNPPNISKPSEVGPAAASIIKLLLSNIHQLKQ